ncbi:unnamed protein product [Prunus armeniaca]|uniref:Uncharacterized protein n=1 Tax=Prunus armeniaca TaxID=36596 RepID=A0A6J5XPP5_PRUAR|nr:unnamed protein product [Prunus armeniaca]CAB4313915.1 unnamed protein product [Prunus armeniaca]
MVVANELGLRRSACMAMEQEWAIYSKAKEWLPLNSMDAHIWKVVCSPFDKLKVEDALRLPGKWRQWKWLLSP